MKVLVTGASGGLGRYVCRVAGEIGWTVLAPSHAELDVTSAASVESYVRAHCPDAILHLAGLSNVDRCQQVPEAAVHLNTLGTLNLTRLRTHVVYMSTNDVFSELVDAGIEGPYDDQTVPAPGNAYAWSKYAGEQAVLAAGGVVVRANFFTRHCRAKESFVSYVLRNAIERWPFDCYTNVMACPVFAGTLAKALCELTTAPSGIFHVGTVDAVNRLEQAREICRAYFLDSSFARPALLENRAGRPLDARLMPSSCIEPLYVRDEINKLCLAESL